MLATLPKLEFPRKFAPIFKPARYKIIHGGRGGAKSWSVARALLLTAANSRKRILCGRELQNSIRESVLKLLADQIDAMGLGGFYKVSATNIMGANGSEFMFEGLRHNATKIKSLESIDIAWIEQAERVSKTSLDILIPTIRKEGSEIWMTLNPELEEDEAYQRFVVRPPDGATVIEMSWRDNPWFPQVLRAEMLDMQKRDPDSWLNIWEGKCRHTLEGAIYARELRDAVEGGRVCKVPVVNGAPIYTSWDLGHSDNTAIWFFQRIGLEFHFVDFHQDNARKLDEYLSLMQAKRYLYGRHYLPHDADNEMLGARSITSQIEAVYPKQVVVVPRTGNIAADINVSRNVFAQCWFDVDRCADGLQALRHYRYSVDEETGRRSRLPLHDWSCFDGSTVVLTRSGKKKIMDLEFEGEVLTPCGWKRYTNAGITGYDAPLVEVRFSDGLSVRCTPEHMFLTDSGWKSAEHLAPNTVIQSCLTPSRSISMAVFTGFGRVTTTTREAASRFIGALGRWRSDLSRLGVTSTTATATGPTITYPTSNACQQASIYPLHGNRVGVSESRGSTLTKRRRLLLRSGTVQRKDGFGTADTRSALRAGPSGDAKSGHVRAAALKLWRWFERAAMRNYTAPQFAKPLRIIGVKRLSERSTVWCLTVPDDACFALSNGAVVHNSDAADAFRTFAVGFRPEKMRRAETRQARLDLSDEASLGWMQA